MNSPEFTSDPELYTPEGFDATLAALEKLNIESPRSPDVENRPRLEVLGDYVAYLSEIIKMPDSVPFEDMEIKLGDKTLKKAKHNFMLGLQLDLFQLAHEKRNFILNSENRVRILKISKEIQNMTKASDELKSNLSVEDNVSQHQIREGQKALKEEQMPKFNNLLSQVIEILKQEIKIAA